MLLSDDAEFSAVLGHCVIEYQTDRMRVYGVQGLTGADFHCRAYSSDHIPSTTEAKP